MEWFGHIKRRLESTPVRHIKELHVQGTGKSRTVVKTLNAVRIQVRNYSVAEKKDPN